MEEVVVFTEHPLRDGRRLAVARLNAPRSLNALSWEMIRLLMPRLESWAADPGIAAVWLEGTGDRAFCAGGDVLGLYKLMTEGRPEEGDCFFAEEYRLHYTLHTFPKPLIVWGNGIVLGGGLGMMAGAGFRVATETAHLAMPENGIGLWPDAGAGWFLNRMPRHMGLFIGLTGAPLNAADALFVGLADRFIPHSDRDATFAALAQENWQEAESDAAAIGAILREREDSASVPMPESRIRPNVDRIRALTDADTLPDLVGRWNAYRGDDSWLAKAAANVEKGSPTSMALFYRQMEQCRHLSLAAIFQRELVLGANSLRGGEFAEGIRALLVDKDKQPRWRYSSAAQLDPSWVDGFFVPPWPEGVPDFLYGSQPLEHLFDRSP